jgi:hypothetical protein
VVCIFYNILDGSVYFQEYSYANQEALRAKANDSEQLFICPIQPRLGVGG